MSSFRVVITGATGFVGQWMLNTAPPDVDIYPMNREGYENGHLDTMSFTHCVHLANISPTRVIKATQRNEARLLYCSSGAVYDMQTEYANNKKRWEVECHVSGVDIVIARLFTFYGDGIDSGKAIHQFFKSAREGKPLQVWGDGSTVRSYMHGAQLGRAMWDVLMHGWNGEAYDIGSMFPTTTLRLAKRISKFTGCGIEFVDKPIDNPYYLPNQEMLWYNKIN